MAALNRYREILFVPAGVLITLVLLALTGVLPLKAVAMFAVALPAAYIHMRQGTASGATVVLSTAGILVWTGGYREALAYLGEFGLMSFFLPMFLKRGLSWDRSVTLTLGLLLALGGLALAGAGLVGEVNVFSWIEGYLQQEQQQYLAMIRDLNLQPEQLSQLEALIKQAAAFSRQAWPAVAVISAAGLQLVTLILLHKFQRGDYRISGVPMHCWKLPELLVWALIASGGGVVLGSGMLKLVALNLLLVVLACYFLQGLAIMSHYFRKNRVPPILRTLGYVLVVTLNPLPVIVTGLGVFDLWVNFRKPRKIND
ncbi:MAG: DUF2232 domain-containing protein [Syntrophotaleaceae bacterium]